MAAFLDVGDVGGRPLPEIPVEPLGNFSRGERTADRIVADSRLDGVNLADSAIANELAGEAISRVGALLASGLEDFVVLARCLVHRLAFLDRQGQGFFAVDVAPRLHRGDRRQRVPVVDRADGHRVEILAVEQLAEVVVLGAIRSDSRGGLVASLVVNVANRDELDAVLLHRRLHDASSLAADADRAHHDLVVGADPPWSARGLFLLGGDNLLGIPKGKAGGDKAPHRPLEESAARE